MEWEDLKAKRGDRILKKWNQLVAKGDDSSISLGASTRARSIPGGGVHVIGETKSKKVPHPWRMGYVDEDGLAIMREGSVAGQLPWITEEFRLGDFNEDDELVSIQLSPKEEGFSFVAVGVNVSNSESDRAEIDPEAGYDQLRIAELDALPAGLGSGGVVPDADGWAWYPLVRVRWEENLMVAQFQIVRHNLNHLVVDDGEGNARHFFPPAA